MKQKDYHGHHPRLQPRHGDAIVPAPSSVQRARNASVPPPSPATVNEVLRSVELLGGSIDESDLLAHALGDRRLGHRQDLRQVALGMGDAAIVSRLREAIVVQ
jgi:hypothetical protein